MSKFDEALVLYKKEMTDTIGCKVDDDILRTVTKSLGPSIYLKDASKVSCSDPKELDRVKNNFLIKKLGMSDDAKMDTAIKAVCDQMGSSNRNKFRAIFYYLLAEKVGKQSMFKK